MVVDESEDALIGLDGDARVDEGENVCTNDNPNEKDDSGNGAVLIVINLPRRLILLIFIDDLAYAAIREG